MSEILSNIVLQPINSTFVAETNAINVTPEAIQLNIFTAGAPGAGNSSNGELLYNNNATIDGLPNAIVSNNTLRFTNLANLQINGGLNHYYLQTDGTGNLTWAIGTGNMQGNGTVSGANTQIQFNDGGNSFGGNAGFTFEKPSGNVNIPGNLNVVGNIIGNFIPNYANFAGTAFNVSGGNVSGPVSNAAYSDFAGQANTANFATFATTANAVAGANVSGQVSNALLAGTVYTNAQPNITSLGTLTGLNVNGTTSIYEAIENVAIIGAQTGTYNYNLLDGAIQYSNANATGNLTLNFRGNSSVTANTFLSTGQSTVGTYLMQTGATAYGITAVTIDGNAQSISWASNSVPTLYSNTTMSYTFTLIKTASTTYKVLGTGVRYG
jgi:hypothetical protein